MSIISKLKPNFNIKRRRLLNLIIDIGNSSTKLSVFDKNEMIVCLHDSNYKIEHLDEICNQYSIEKGILATVIELSKEIKEQLSNLKFPVLILNEETDVPLVNLYETPKTLGYDRIAAVVGAIEEQPQKDLLVIDAGTAITYEFVDAEGRYHGGNISPGVNMRFKALHHFTGKLPLIEREGRDLPLGKDTSTAIRAGVIRGIEYEILGYIDFWRRKYPELLVFLTGGDKFSFDSKIKNIIFADRFLVLKGLNRILNYNNDKI